MQISAVLCLDYQLKDGTYPINIRVSFRRNGKSRYKNIPIGVRVKKQEWDSKQGMVKADRVFNAVGINKKIIQVVNKAKEKMLDGTTPDEIFDVIRDAVNPKRSETEKAPLIKISEYFENYIDLCKKGKIIHYRTSQPLSESYIKTIGTAAGRLEAFNEEEMSGALQWKDIGDDFYSSFVSYLRFKHQADNKTDSGLKENTIGITIKRLLLVFGRAIKDGLLPAGCLDKFIVIEQDVDTIALSESEIQKIIDADLSASPHLERERKRFLIAYNFLLRFGDSISVDKKHIVQEDGKHYFRMTTTKTKEPVFIPIMPVVHKILMGGFKMKEQANQNSNANLKDLGKAAGIDSDYLHTEIIKGKKVEKIVKKYLLMTTHTTRRSGATNMYLSGIDPESIRQFGAWRTTDQMMDYIKITKLENAKRQSSHEFFGLK